MLVLHHVAPNLRHNNGRTAQPCAPSVLRKGGTLLQDLITATAHARAAYGYAMAAGHVSSVAAYIKLQTWQKLR